jgi:GSCFA family
MRSTLTIGLNFRDHLFQDRLIHYPAWAPYPDLAHRMGIKSDFLFKKHTIGRLDDTGGIVVGLRDFIAAEFRSFEEMPKQDARFIPEIDIVGYDAAIRATLQEMPPRPISKAAAAGERETVAHPYRGLPDYQFWRKSVSEVDLQNIDPVLGAKFRITRKDRIASAGSCFAQHISKALKSCGYSYLITEPSPPDMTSQEAAANNYGVFSARYANLYTARQLRQLFDRAFGHFVPKGDVWAHADGGFVDAFRPQIKPDRFETIQDVLDDRATHLAAVCKMFEEVDVFIYTFGLTEGWQSLEDGAIYPLAPGVSGGKMDDARYAPLNFTVAETEDDFRNFMRQLRAINPAVRIILTVSPVPLTATFEDRSVICSTSLSKSVLRVAAENLCKNEPNIAYYPSFEIITGPFTQGRYFEADARSVAPEGVQHAMTLFLRHYGDAAASVPAAALPPDSAVQPPNTNSLNELICEEGALDAID